MSKVIERLAEAMHSSYGIMIPWRVTDDKYKASRKMEAKRALEALLELDDEVINAGIRAGVDLGFGVGRPEYEELWKAFITEALKC